MSEISSLNAHICFIVESKMLITTIEAGINIIRQQKVYFPTIKWSGRSESILGPTLSRSSRSKGVTGLDLTDYQLWARRADGLNPVESGVCGAEENVTSDFEVNVMY